MSGFATSWLDRREPADHAARDAALLQEAVSFLDAGSTPRRIVDLGCGTGSTLRAFGPAGARFDWRLIDNDPSLLAEARRRVPEGCSVEAIEADLAALDPAILADAKLVSASALFDLCSQGFVETLLDRLAASRIGLYAVLNYDGICHWSDPHPLDGEIVDAFNHHQQSDKGFGRALGPASGQALVWAAEARGYRAVLADSPWRLDPSQAELQTEFLQGMASAVSETGWLSPSQIEEWLAARMARISSGTCTVGHSDVLALPPIA